MTWPQAAGGLAYLAFVVGGIFLIARREYLQGYRAGKVSWC